MKKDLFLICVRELGHALGLYHNSTDKDSVMAPFYKHAFSVENKHEILEESDNVLIQEMYGEGRSASLRAISNSAKSKSDA